jgi:hypothetical protein
LDVVLPDETKTAQDAGVLIFHAVGDSGGIHGDDVEKAISTAMDNQISAVAADKQPSPAFYYNLGTSCTSMARVSCTRASFMSLTRIATRRSSQLPTTTMVIEHTTR